MEEKHLQMSESFFLTAILAIVGGFLDSYSYLMRGHRQEISYCLV